jgi:hypothetical protein
LLCFRLYKLSLSTLPLYYISICIFIATNLQYKFVLFYLYKNYTGGLSDLLDLSVARPSSRTTLENFEVEKRRRQHIIMMDDKNTS